MARATFGLQLSIWNASLDSPAYSPIGGLTDLTPPILQAEKPVDTTSHDSPEGIGESIPAGLQKWSECSGEYTDKTGDVGQALLEDSIDTIQKFKLVKAGVTDPVYFNATVVSSDPGPEPLVGKGTHKFKVQPTGVPPTS